MKITDTHIYFYSGKEIYSNWYSSPAQFFDKSSWLVFANTEQHFMWSKATFFGDSETACKIAKETDARSVKEYGREVKDYDEKKWECVRLGFMTYANYLKFSQNELFKDQLLSTDNKILVEASRTDKIWGVGLTEDDPLILDEKNWKGRNLLGVALMNVRNLLK